MHESYDTLSNSDFQMEKIKSSDKLVGDGAKTECFTDLAISTSETESCNDIKSAEVEEEYIYKLEIVWLNVISLLIFNLMGFYGFYLTFTTANIRTTVLAYVLAYTAGLGVSAGSHRLWSHRSYKATLPMRILLMLMQSSANEDCIYYWARDHRLHHKYTDTNADPYNSLRGFFFSHMGWLMVKKHPDVKKFGKGIDLSDLTSDPVVVFQKKYFLIIMLLTNFIIPICIPMYFWNESFKVAFFVMVWKWIYSLHCVWCLNSVSHTWGYKPYDRFSTATDSPCLAVPMLGEAWHNYHPTFPWDYNVPDLPFHTVHPTAKFIEFFAWFGLIYDLKSVSLNLAKKQAKRNGDGSIQTPDHGDNFSHKSSVWGWGNDKLKLDDRNGT